MSSGAASEITLRTRALAAVMAHAAQGVVLARPLPGERVRIEDCNPAFQRLTGHPCDALIGQGLEIITGPSTDERKLARLLQRATRTVCAIGSRFVWTRRDGVELLAELTVVPLGAGAEPELLLLLFRDVTEHEQLSERLQHSERLAAVGALAAGLGHEINSPLAAVLTHLELMGEALPRFIGEAEQHAPGLVAQAARLDEHVEAARTQAEQVKAAVQSLQLLVSARASAAAPVTLVDLPAAVDAALRLARPELRPRTRIVRSYQEVAAVHGDAARVQQAFLQLFLHVARVLPEGDAHARELRVSLAAGAGARAHATIECRAADVAPDAIAQGLAPSIIQTIVTSYGGRLSVHCGAQSARFDVELPTGAAPPVSAAAARGRLLLVDDDKHFLTALRLALTEDHDVEVAPGGAAAIERLRRDPGYDLILCDMHMDGLSGIDVLEALRREAPEAARRFVFMTGGAVTERARTYLAETDRACLLKPFELDTLRGLVRQRVDDRHADVEEDP